MNDCLREKFTECTAFNQSITSLALGASVRQSSWSKRSHLLKRRIW